MQPCYGRSGQSETSSLRPTGLGCTNNAPQSPSIGGQRRHASEAFAREFVRAKRRRSAAEGRLLRVRRIEVGEGAFRSPPRYRMSHEGLGDESGYPMAGWRLRSSQETLVPTSQGT